MPVKNVLVIAYYFPPTGGGGVQRVTKFVKYLPSLGYRPVVLTVKNPDFYIFDESLLEDIPEGVKVFRTHSFEPVRWYRVRRYGPKSRYEPAAQKRPRNKKKSLLETLLYPVKLLFMGVKNCLINIILVPDDYIGWIPFAVLKGRSIIRKEKIDVIYATGKPWSAFLIAFFLRLLTGKPYILDLRDLWVLTPYDNPCINRVRKKIEGFWEKKCFQYAEKVVNINEQINNSYIKHYPSMPSDKFACITHGFDPADFLTAKKMDKDTKFTMSYIGTIYSNTLPDNFLTAVSDVISENPGLRDAVKLRFVGFVPSYVLSIVKNLGIGDIVETPGCLSHRESIQYMMSSDVLVLLLNKVESNPGAQVSTGKLFEYLAARRPVLALIPESTDAAKLINEHGAGKVIDPDNRDGIKEAIYDFYKKYKKGDLNGHSKNLVRFDRRELTGRLSLIINQI